MSKRGERRQRARSQQAQAMPPQNNHDGGGTQGASAEPPISMPVIPQTTVSPNKDQREADAQKKNLDQSPNEALLARYTRSLRNWTVGLVFVGLLTVGVLSLQWLTFEKTDQTLHKTLDASTRAWIVPKSVTFDPLEMGKPIRIQIQYENVGKEPAINVAEYNYTHLGDAAETQNFISGVRQTRWEWCKAQPAVAGAAVVYPGNSPETTSQYHITTDSIADAAFVAGDKTLIIYGCFSYETASRPAHSSFCRMFNIKLSRATLGCFAGEYAE